MVSAQQADMERFMQTMMGLMFVIIPSIIILMGWIGALCIFIGGRCLARRKRYNFCIFAAAMCCLFMPFGTILGVFSIIVLVRPSVKMLFEDQQCVKQSISQIDRSADDNVGKEKDAKVSRTDHGRAIGTSRRRERPGSTNCDQSGRAKQRGEPELKRTKAHNNRSRNYSIECTPKDNSFGQQTRHNFVFLPTRSLQSWVEAVDPLGDSVERRIVVAGFCCPVCCCC